QRVAVEQLRGIVLEEAQYGAGLHRMRAVPLSEPGIVIAQRRSLLKEVLRRVASADADDADVIAPDQRRVQRLRVPVESLMRERELVEPLRARPLPASQHRVDLLLNVLGRFEARLVAEATDVRLNSAAVAYVHVVP